MYNRLFKLKPGFFGISIAYNALQVVFKHIFMKRNAFSEIILVMGIMPYECIKTYFEHICSTLHTCPS